MTQRTEPRIKECTLISSSEGIKCYAPKTHVYVHDEVNQIKILHIGKPNDLQTKAILLIGETGSGKTSLLNSFCNHISGVEYDDQYRMQIIDETGEESKEDYDSQTEFITGYLFHYEPGMRYKYNFLIIDTPGLADTRGSGKQGEILQQMEIFLKEKKFGIIDLHCLGFVVKATTNRKLEYFGDILQKCIKLFGKNTKTITQIMATHAVDKAKGLKKLLETCGLSAESVFNFDNGIIYEPNTAGLPDSSGDRLEEDDIIENRRRWVKRAKECDAFFQLLFRIPSVSLRLTQELLREKAHLEQTKQTLNRHIETAFSCILANKENIKTLNDYESSMKENKAWKGKQLVLVKTRVPIDEESRWYQFDAHVHYCSKCDKSCTDICHFWVSCPDSNTVCTVCDCPVKYHVKGNEIVKENWVEEDVTDTDMKEKYDNAKNMKKWLEEQMTDLQKQEQKHRHDIAKMITYVRFQTERLSEISIVPIRQTPSQFMEEILQDVIRNNPHFNRNLDDEYLNAFIESVLCEAKTLNIDKNTWKQELDKLLSESDSAWNKTLSALKKVANAVGSKGKK